MTDEQLKNYKRHFATHKATIVLDSERYFAVDWRRSDGSGEYYVNYIVDKQRGSLIVSGDLGDSIATWYNKLTLENLKEYIGDIGYYMGKMQCTSDYSVFDIDDIVSDIQKNLEDYSLADEFILRSTAYQNKTQLWDDIKELVDISVMDNGCENNFIPCDSLLELVSSIDDECNQWLYQCGRRTAPRVYLWSVGFRMALDQLGIGKESNL